MQHQVLAALKEVEGYAGAKLLERQTDDGVEVVVITFGQSFDAIRQFAGSELEHALVSEAASPLLLEYDQRVKHYEVVIEDKT